MNEIKISRNIPIPHNRWTAGVLYQLRQVYKRMKVGDSFMFDDNKTPHRAAEQCKIKVITRKVNGEGYRVWRIS